MWSREVLTCFPLKCGLVGVDKEWSGAREFPSLQRTCCHGHLAIPRQDLLITHSFGRLEASTSLAPAALVDEHGYPSSNVVPCPWHRGTHSHLQYPCPLSIVPHQRHLVPFPFVPDVASERCRPEDCLELFHHRWWFFRATWTIDWCVSWQIPRPKAFPAFHEQARLCSNR